jgi:hypothetical protein
MSRRRSGQVLPPVLGEGGVVQRHSSGTLLQRIMERLLGVSGAAIYQERTGRLYVPCEAPGGCLAAAVEEFSLGELHDGLDGLVWLCGFHAGRFREDVRRAGLRYKGSLRFRGVQLGRRGRLAEAVEGEWYRRVVVDNVTSIDESLPGSGYGGEN